MKLVTARWVVWHGAEERSVSEAALRLQTTGEGRPPLGSISPRRSPPPHHLLKPSISSCRIALHPHALDHDRRVVSTRCFRLFRSRSCRQPRARRCGRQGAVTGTLPGRQEVLRARRPGGGGWARGVRGENSSFVETCQYYATRTSVSAVAHLASHRGPQGSSTQKSPLSK